MTYSGTFLQIMNRMFANYGTYNPLTDITLDENVIYNKNLVVDLKNKEIPICIENVYRRTGLASNDNTKLVLPLYEHISPETKRTFNSTLRSLFCNVGGHSDLIKVTTSKGEVYYGKRGLILDKDYNPIIMFSLKYHEVKCIEGTSNYAWNKIICRVSPNVFLEPNKLIHKGIIKYIIPYMQEGSINAPRYPGFVYEDCLSRQVIIEDFSDWFTSPVKPKFSEDINESLNDCLIDSLEDILTIVNE